MERMIEINTIVICLVCAEGECEMEGGSERANEKKGRRALWKRWMNERVLPAAVE